MSSNTLDPFDLCSNDTKEPFNKIIQNGRLEITMKKINIQLDLQANEAVLSEGNLDSLKLDFDDTYESLTSLNENDNLMTDQDSQSRCSTIITSLNVEDDAELDSEEDGDFIPIVPSEKIIKSPVTKSLFKDGYDVIYFPKQNEELTQMPKKYLNWMKFKMHSTGPRVIRNAVVAAGFKLEKSSGWLG